MKSLVFGSGTVRVRPDPVFGLSKLPDEWIHKPWEAPMHVLAEAGITLDKQYPVPLVGLTEGRDRALKALKNMRPE